MSERVRVTFEVPKTLLEYVDKECKKKSTEVMKWNRSSFLRKLIIDARDGGRKESKHKEDNNVEDDFNDFLDLSGYKK